MSGSWSGGIVLGLFGLLGTTSPGWAQFTLQATRTAKPPVIDGEIADGEWPDAGVASAFVQFEPQRGQPSPYRTEALVLYDARFLYVAFRAWDPEPLTAQLPSETRRWIVTTPLGCSSTHLRIVGRPISSP